MHKKYALTKSTQESCKLYFIVNNTKYNHLKLNNNETEEVYEFPTGYL